MDNTHNYFFMVVALQAEATPIIHYYKLKIYQESPFKIYHNNNIWLVVSGMGKINAAAATSFLYSISGQKDDKVWVNVGIGGHPHLPLGAVTVAHKVSTQNSESVYYPSFISKCNIATSSIITVDTAETAYPQECVYEMEAIGFYQIATKLSTNEFVHCIKIISDNKNSNIHQINKSKVHSWIEDALPQLQKFIQPLTQYSKEIEEAPIEQELINFFTKNWHFTTANTRILKKLLQQWQVLSPDKSIYCTTLKQNYPETKQILQFIKTETHRASLNSW